jgi:hypothetical protein
MACAAATASGANRFTSRVKRIVDVAMLIAA